MEYVYSLNYLMDFMVSEACWKDKCVFIVLIYFFPFYKLFTKEHDVNLISIKQQKFNKCTYVY